MKNITIEDIENTVHEIAENYDDIQQQFTDALNENDSPYTEVTVAKIVQENCVNIIIDSLIKLLIEE